MLTPEEYAELSNHREALELFHFHNYVPRGENGHIHAINGIFSKKFNRPPADVWCNGCLEDMMRIMYNEYHAYEKQKAIEGTIVQPTTSEAEEIKQITDMPKFRKPNKKKR